MTREATIICARFIVNSSLTCTCQAANRSEMSEKDLHKVCSACETNHLSISPGRDIHSSPH